MKYRIARDMGRQIGLDLLIVNHFGMSFLHPSFMRAEEMIFEGNLNTCRALALVIGDCFIITENGKRI